MQDSLIQIADEMRSAAKEDDERRGCGVLGEIDAFDAHWDGFVFKSICYTTIKTFKLFIFFSTFEHRIKLNRSSTQFTETFNGNWLDNAFRCVPEICAISHRQTQSVFNKF